MVEQVKELRINIDALSQLVANLHKPSDPWKNANWRIYTTKEVEHSYDSLIFAKAWLGKILGELGSPSPYQNDGTRKSVEDIEETSDTYSISKLPSQNNSFKEYFSITDSPNILWSNKNHIEKVDWLRQEIQKLDKLTDPYRDYEEASIWEDFTTKALAYLFNANRHLAEARFWLGFELERIKNSNQD